MGISDILNIIGTIFTGFSTGTSMYGALSGTASNRKLLNDQYNYQQKLNEQAFSNQKEMFNMYNDRQDQLMRLSPTIQKQALKAAGYSTMAGNGSTSASAPTVVTSSPQSGGSAPSAAPAISARQQSLSDLSRTFENLFTDISDVSLKRAQREKVASEKTYQDIINLGARAQQEAEINRLVSEKKLSDVQADRLRFQLGIEKETREMTIQSKWAEMQDKFLSNALKENEVKMIDITNQLKQNQLKISDKQYGILSKEYESFDKRLLADLSKTYSEIELNDRKSIESASNVALNKMKESLAHWDAVLKKVDYAYAVATSDIRIETAQIMIDEIKKKIELMTKNIDMQDQKNMREWLRLLPDIINDTFDEYKDAFNPLTSSDFGNFDGLGSLKSLDSSPASKQLPANVQ